MEIDQTYNTKFTPTGRHCIWQDHRDNGGDHRNDRHRYSICFVHEGSKHGDQKNNWSRDDKEIRKLLRKMKTEWMGCETAQIEPGGEKVIQIPYRER